MFLAGELRLARLHIVPECEDWLESSVLRSCTSSVLALPTQSNCISSHNKAVSAAAGCPSHAKVMDHLDEANDSAQIISSWFVQLQKIAEELEAHQIDGPTGASCMFAV